jgi:hypothetical protein
MKNQRQEVAGDGNTAASANLRRETVRRLVKDEVGVVKIRMGRKKAHTI